MSLNLNNISTIATLIAGLIAPIIVKYCGFSIDEATITGVIVLIIAYISARNPNTFSFLGNAVDTASEKVDEVSEVLDEASEIIDEMENATVEDTTEVEKTA